MIIDENELSSVHNILSMTKLKNNNNKNNLPHSNRPKWQLMKDSSYLSLGPYLRKLKTMKVCTFTTRLIQLNNYDPYFPPDGIGQIVIALPNYEVMEILYHAIPNSWRKKMTKQGYNYHDRSI